MFGLPFTEITGTLEETLTNLTTPLMSLPNTQCNCYDFVRETILCERDDPAR